MAQTHAQGANTEQSPAPQLILLHLLPEVLVVIFDVIAAAIVRAMGMPPHFTIIVGNGLVLAGFEIGYLLRQGKRASGRLSLKGAILYREPIPWWQYIALIVLLLVSAFGALSLLLPVGAGLRESTFSWMPAVFLAADTPPDATLYSHSALVVTAVFLFIFTGIVVPVVEELYYRGHLMARMSRWGWWAPVVSVALWSLNHLWQPWQIPSFIVAFLPIVLVVQWKRNAYISLAVHTIGNVLNTFALVGALLGLVP